MTPKFTWPQLINGALALIGATGIAYTWINAQSTDIKDFKTEIKSEIQQVKSTQDIIVLQQKNQYQELKNDAKRENQDRTERFEDLKAEVTDVKDIVKRMAFGKGTVTGN